MAQLVDTIWANGLWSDTVWADGVWGAPTPRTPPQATSIKRSGFLRGVGRMLPRIIVLFALLGLS